MAGAVGVRSFADTNSCPCLCLETLNSRNRSGKMNLENNGLLLRHSTKMNNKSLDLSSSFLDSWYDYRWSAKMLSYAAAAKASGCSRKQAWASKLSIRAAELGGQYEEGFDDVKSELINYITLKAVRTVLHQLYEMNPPQYMWFHNFVASAAPDTGRGFLQALAKEDQGLAERVMITRLHLYAKWIKACDHTKIYESISDENVELMRERLMQTIIWPSDDANTENMDQV